MLWTGWRNVAICVLAMLPGLQQSASCDDVNKPPVYTVDSNASRVYIRIDSATRIGHAHGIEGRFSACEVDFGGGGALAFDMNSFQADTFAARQYVGLDPNFSQAAAVNTNMRGPAVLNVGRFPKASFTISSIEPKDRQAAGTAGRYRFAGKLNLRGISHDVRFNASLQPSKQNPNAMRLTGTFTILQSSYGIEPYSALGGLIRLADELQISGDLILLCQKN